MVMAENRECNFVLKNTAFSRAASTRGKNMSAAIEYNLETRTFSSETVHKFGQNGNKYLGVKLSTEKKESKIALGQRFGDYQLDISTNCLN